MHDRDRIERLIDRAASSLTEVPDARAFTARVLARLDAPPVRHPTWWRVLVVVPAAAAVLLLVVAGWWQQGGFNGPATPATRVLDSRALPTAALLVPAAREATSPPADRAGGGRTPALPAVSGSASAANLPRVPGYEPIALDVVAIAPVGADDDGVAADSQLELSPIEVERLAIDPIDLSRPRGSEPNPFPGGRQ